ncbi:MULTISPECIES: class I SAM-dependent methyltransferase [unclassified Streptomyces]|uniref:class I SAM-dependent methyltransferase n=1 Tax=unclassified Streptomyces TaxID=2593676 RepID=UPI00093ED149|nr:class I SAM-dependent methyltransferase [Streptomyces sp. TSRI0281]OKI31783.1 methyltransferase type 11 [Streptomyces sp. TSRI0281]
MLHGEFRDARLVAVYDAQCPWSREDDFFLSVVGRVPGARVLDLGCGTGRLALGMAAAGHRVTGVDPARASLEAARAKPGAGRVVWVEGTSSVLPDASFDVAVMTSHVAQFFVADDAWARALADLRRSLVPGGRIVFDTRDPRARGWERWNPVDSEQRVELPDGGSVTVWTEVTAVRDAAGAGGGAGHVADCGLMAGGGAGAEGVGVGFTHHYAFPDGAELTSTATLRFRTEDELRSSLRDAGFEVERLYGGWNREPVGAGDGEFLVLAHR